MSTVEAVAVVVVVAAAAAAAAAEKRMGVIQKATKVRFSA